MKIRALQNDGKLKKYVGRRALSVLLAASMLAGTVPSGAISAYASEEALSVVSDGGGDAPLTVGSNADEDTGQGLVLNEDSGGGLVLDGSSGDAYYDEQYDPAEGGVR